MKGKGGRKEKGEKEQPPGIGRWQRESGHESDGKDEKAEEHSADEVIDSSLGASGARSGVRTATASAQCLHEIDTGREASATKGKGGERRGTRMKY
jgi:hypothetical protein